MREFWWNPFTCKTTDSLSSMLVRKDRYEKALLMTSTRSCAFQYGGKCMWAIPYGGFHTVPRHKSKPEGNDIAQRHGLSLCWGSLHPLNSAVAENPLCSLKKCCLVTHFQAAAWEHSRALLLQLDEMFLGEISLTICVYHPSVTWYTVFSALFSQC